MRSGGRASAPHRRFRPVARWESSGTTPRERHYHPYNVESVASRKPGAIAPASLPRANSRYVAAAVRNTIGLLRLARAGMTRQPSKVLFAMRYSRGPTLGFGLNAISSAPLPLREAAHQLMYATRIQRSADRANALAASSSDAFSARRS